MPSFDNKKALRSDKYRPESIHFPIYRSATSPDFLIWENENEI